MDEEKEKQEVKKTKQKEFFRLLFPLNTSKHSMHQGGRAVIS